MLKKIILMSICISLLWPCILTQARYIERQHGTDALFVDVNEGLPYTTGDNKKKALSITIQRLINREGNEILDYVMLKVVQNTDFEANIPHLQIKQAYLCTLEPLHIIRVFVAHEKHVTLLPPYRTEHAMPTNGITNIESRKQTALMIENAQKEGKTVYLRLITSDSLYTDLPLTPTFCAELITLCNRPSKI